jgi:hypothetical protein
MWSVMLTYFPVDSHKPFWNQLAGRNGTTFLSALWPRKAFHELGVQDVAEFNSD